MAETMFDSSPVHRLPRWVKPYHYTIGLRPDLQNFTFSGTVAIDAEVIDPCDVVILNAIELVVASATAFSNGKKIELAAEMKEETEQVALSGGHFEPGPVRLELEFSGVLNDRLRGFYRSTVVIQGVEHTVASTQFQSTDARRCFPCFDEPDRKATFGITLEVPPEMLAISNGAEISRTRVEGEGNSGERFDRVVFENTIPLPTYLVAFVIGPLEATAPVDVDGVPVRVIHPPGRASQTTFALEVAAHSLRWLADWYDIPIPGGKVDLVALPDFAFGAMENLGCITFREVLLLIDPSSADQQELQRVAAVISHELAHLWFGDLVTMRWWNGIWLNEAFATFMEMKAVEAFRDDWDVWTDFASARSAALDVDALNTTRPIEHPVVTPDDAESMFDLLTYEKGAAVVRMLEQYVGEDAFRNGIRRYLSAHLGGNTENADLWAALETATDQPVTDLMENWIFQGGHPIVEVELSDNRQSCLLTQRQFRYMTDCDNSDQDWSIPMRLRTSLGEHRVLLGARPAELAFEGQLLTANADSSGFYRTIGVDGCEPNSLTAIERASVIDNCWAATLADLVEPSDFTVLARSFTERPGGECDLAVWQAVLKGLKTIDLVAPERREKTNAEAASLLTEVVEQLGWTPQSGEDGRTRRLRGIVLAAAGTLANRPEILDEAKHRHESADTDPAVEAAVISIVAAHGDATIRTEYRHRIDSAATPQEEQRYLQALGLFPGKGEIDALLAEIHDGTIRTQDAAFLLSSALTHTSERARVWSSIVDRWEDLTVRLPSNSIARMLGGIQAMVVDHEPEVEAFLNTHPIPQGGLMIDQYLERRRVNLRLRERLLSG